MTLGLGKRDQGEASRLSRTWGAAGLIFLHQDKGGSSVVNRHAAARPTWHGLQLIVFSGGLWYFDLFARASWQWIHAVARISSRPSSRTALG
jgi:hypothetical protein